METGYQIESCLSNPEWHAWRRTGVGASEAACIAGVSRRPGRMELWLEKLGQGRPREATEAMEWGKRLEDDIADAYTHRTGLAFRHQQLHVRSAVRPWQIASLDAVAEDDRLVEFKAVGIWSGGRLHEGDADTLPRAWHLQVQHQMAIVGARVADVAVFTPELRLLVFTLPRNELLISALSDLEAEFWSFVERKVPPPALDMGDAERVIRWAGVDGRRVKLDAEALGHVQAYEDACGVIKEFEDIKARAKDAILRMMGNASHGLLPDGRVVRLSTVSLPDRVQTVRAHTQLRLTLRMAEHGD